MQRCPLMMTSQCLNQERSTILIRTIIWMYIFIPMPTMKASVCLAFIGMDLSVILTTEDANTSITKNLKKI